MDIDYTLVHFEARHVVHILWLLPHELLYTMNPRSQAHSACESCSVAT